VYGGGVVNYKIKECYRIKVSGGIQLILATTTEDIHISGDAEGCNTLYFNQMEYSLYAGDVVEVDGETVWEEVGL